MEYLLLDFVPFGTRVGSSGSTGFEWSRGALKWPSNASSHRCFDWLVNRSSSSSMLKQILASGPEWSWHPSRRVTSSSMWSSSPGTMLPKYTNYFRLQCFVHWCTWHKFRAHYLETYRLKEYNTLEWRGAFWNSHSNWRKWTFRSSTQLSSCGYVFQKLNYVLCVDMCRYSLWRPCVFVTGAEMCLNYSACGVWFVSQNSI